MTQPLDLTTDLKDIFDRPLQLALEQHDPAVSDATRGYVVQLLVDHAVHQPDDGDAPFAILLDRAMSEPRRQRLPALRRLGDRILYLTGFFKDHVERRGLARSYLTGVGARAYGAAADLLRPPTHHSRADVPDVFAELADHFAALARSLEEVAETLRVQRQASSPRGVVELYERWLATGSRVTAAELAARGVLVGSGPAGVLQ